MKIITNRFSVACLLLACLSQLNAAEPSRPEAGLWYLGEGPGSVEDGSGSRFSATQWGFEIPLEKKQRKTERFQSRIHMEWTEFDWQGAGAAEGEYIWLSMPVLYQQQRGRKHQFLLNLEPGLMTDGGNVGFDHIGLNGSAVGRKLWRNGGYWQYGVIVDRRFGDYDARPVLGMAWQASKRTWMELGFPETHVRHTLSSTVQSFFHIDRKSTRLNSSH